VFDERAAAPGEELLDASFHPRPRACRQHDRRHAPRRFTTSYKSRAGARRLRNLKFQI
jgi:hypothetical protein